MRKNEQSKKFRGVRQRHWGSWVSEIRHPLLKKRVWLGTFETAEAAARAYDEAAVLMNGRNAKTNFPSATQNTDDHSTVIDPTAQNGLSKILHAKLSKRGKTSSSRAVTCLRLDTVSCNIGVWQKSAGDNNNNNNDDDNNSKWILRTAKNIDAKTFDNAGTDDLGQTKFPSSFEVNNCLLESEFSTKLIGGEDYLGGAVHEDDQDRVARQMIDELLLI